MAVVRSLKVGSQEVRAHTTEVDCFYQVVVSGSGGKLLHLSTFGSDDRRTAPKSSQSIQINETIARQLVEILAPILRN